MLEVPFAGFGKIAERPEEWRLDEEGYRRLRTLDWVVTEKVHGANFVVATDGRDVNFAKRKAWLEPNEEFFGYQLLVPFLTEKARQLFSDLSASDESLRHLFIYGELFGGAYPHPAVAPDPRVEAVQTGVYYSPRIEFVVFDITTVDGLGKRRFLPFQNALECATTAGFLALPPLLIAPYTKAVAFPLGFESTIPSHLGLPALAKGNKAEGVVIKPLNSIVLQSGESLRPILKRKIPEFAEDAMYDGARKWKPVAGLIADEHAAIQLLLEQIPSFLTPQRLASARSKVGRLDGKDVAHRAQFIDAVWEDLADKFKTDFSDFWRAISDHGKKDFEDRARRELERLE